MTTTLVDFASVLCRIAQPIEKLHVVWPGGRALCGLRISDRDCFIDTAGGWAIWQEWPSRRCLVCLAHLNHEENHDGHPA